MGLISKEVEVALKGINLKRYERLGYSIPRRKDKWGEFCVPEGTKIPVKVEDLSMGSGAIVSVECDECEKLLQVKWGDYLKCVKEDEKYYCNKCSFKLYGNENLRKRKLKNSGVIAETNPEFIKYFVNIEDTKRYSHASAEKVDMICPDCHSIKKNKRIADLINSGFSCSKCSDGYSYPNKFMFNIFEQLDIAFESEYSPDWCKYSLKNKVKQGYYDFWFELNNKIYILEMDGSWHTKDNKMTGQTKEDSKIIDDEKDKLANEHGIESIRIESEKSELEYIKNKILDSKLNDLFDLSNINWLKCHEYACKSLVKVVCELWNNGTNNTIQIANKLKISKPTVLKYLKQGTEINWVNYNAKEEKMLNTKNKSIPVICLTTDDICESIKGAGRKYNVSNTAILNYCRHKSNYGGKLKNGILLQWQFYSEYLELQEIN